jgi:hypothetical protein
MSGTQAAITAHAAAQDKMRIAEYLQNAHERFSRERARRKRSADHFWVMPGLVLGIHVFAIWQKDVMAGTSPAMTS